MTKEIYCDAMTETLYYLRGIDTNELKKIPKKLIEYLYENANKNYVCDFDYTKPLSELKLKDETKALIGMIYINYICDDEKQKEKILYKLNENERKYQEYLNIEYPSNNLFENNKINSDSTLPAEVKNQTILEKIINKIKSIFVRKKV